MFEKDFLMRYKSRMLLVRGFESDLNRFSLKLPLMRPYSQYKFRARYGLEASARLL